MEAAHLLVLLRVQHVVAARKGTRQEYLGLNHRTNLGGRMRQEYMGFASSPFAAELEGAHGDADLSSSLPPFAARLGFSAPANVGEAYDRWGPHTVSPGCQ